MKNRKTVLITAAILSLSVLSSCGSSSPSDADVSETEAAVQNADTDTAESADRTDIPESEWDGYQDKIYAANQREAVFKNHQNLIMSVDFNIDPGEYKADFNWFIENETYYRAPAYPM